MTNTTRRRIALLGMFALGTALVLTNKGHSTGVATVDAVDNTTAPPVGPPTTEPAEPTTTEPTTTEPTTTEHPTTTTEAPPPTEAPPTTVGTLSPVVTAALVAPPTTGAPALHAQDDAGIQGPVGEGDPAPAARAETGKCVNTDPVACNPPTTPAGWDIPSWARCPQWWPTAQAVGWSYGDMRVLDYIMHRESGCDPHAYARQSCGRGNHAVGLTQLCGWLSASQAYDPVVNLSKALELRQTQGWCPWVLSGDPVTGRACG
jgi:hypothetical protein